MPDIIRYQRPIAGAQPAYLHPAYGSSKKRAPTQPLIKLEHTITEVTGPRFDTSDFAPNEHDLTRQHDGEPVGERIIVSGRILDENNRPIPHTLIEVWQANSAGHYRHERDQHAAPLDPNFTGFGRGFSDANGHYRFVTIKPGAYPWGNHHNAWRPAHIHFSLFGPAFATRLVTQMYFPGDPLLVFDPIFNSIANERARNRLISSFDWDTTIPDTALGYRFDIVLRGCDATPTETNHV